MTTFKRLVRQESVISSKNVRSRSFQKYISLLFHNFPNSRERRCGENSIGFRRTSPRRLLAGEKKLGANIDAIILIKGKKSLPKFSREISRKFSDNERNAPVCLCEIYRTNPGDAYFSHNDYRNDKRRDPRCWNNFRCYPQIADSTCARYRRVRASVHNSGPQIGHRRRAFANKSKAASRRRSEARQADVRNAAHSRRESSTINRIDRASFSLARARTSFVD